MSAKLARKLSARADIVLSCCFINCWYILIVLSFCSQVWVDVWLSTSLGRQQHKQRAIFVESFWWFLHRTTAFGVDVNEADGEMLFSAVLTHCPKLSVQHCPTNMVRCDYLCYVELNTISWSTFIVNFVFRLCCDVYLTFTTY